jgi:hypothetical protein
VVGPVFRIAELLIVPLVLPPQILHKCDEIVDLGTKSRQQKPQSWSREPRLWSLDFAQW